MNKKILFLLAMLVLVVGLTACGEKKPVSSGDTKVVDKVSGEPAKEVAPAPEKKETNPYVANIPNEILDFYKEKIEELEQKNKAQNAQIMADNPDVDITAMNNLKYDLVFFNDDNIPELVVDKEGYNMALYTYDAGKVLYALEDEEEAGWPYGAGGNAGYEYIPRENVLRNYNSDHAGLIRYVQYYNLDETSHKITPINIGELRENYFIDKNNNGELDEDEMEEFSETPTFYIVGTRRATEEEWKAQLIEGEYEPLAGTKSAEQIIPILEGLVNEK